MAIDFPSSPSLNQTYTYGDRSWSWTGVGWHLVSTAAGPQGPTGPAGPKGAYTVSASQPATPISGDVWFDSNSGRTYTYYGTAWVESALGTAGPTGPSGVISVTSPLTNTGTSTAAVLGININSIQLTGVPTAPTASANTSNTQIATTAFVTGQASAVTPIASNTTPAGSVGTSLAYARADHVHPRDSGVISTSGSQTITGNSVYSYPLVISGKPIYTFNITNMYNDANGYYTYVQFSSTHNLVSQESIIITGVNPAGANGTWTVATVQSSTLITLTQNILGSAYITGGTATNGAQQNLLYVTDPTYGMNLNVGAGLVSSKFGYATTGASTTVPPLQYSFSNTLLTTQTAGTLEYDVSSTFITNGLGSGRGIVNASQMIVLPAAAVVASGGQFFTSTVRPQLGINQYYMIKAYLVYTMGGTAPTVTWGFTNSSSSVFYNLYANATTIARGASLTATSLVSNVYASNIATTTSTAQTLVSGTTYVTVIEGFVNQGSTSRLQLIATLGGTSPTLTTVLGSYMVVTSMGNKNVGNIG